MKPEKKPRKVEKTDTKPKAREPQKPAAATSSTASKSSSATPKEGTPKPRLDKPATPSISTGATEKTAETAKIQVPVPSGVKKPTPPATAKAAPLAKPIPSTPSIRSAPTRSKPKPEKPKAKKRTFNIPPILLEGDLSPAPKERGPGTRYAVAPVALAPRPDPTLAVSELPEGYGTRRLFLAARDPRWLYASWDLTAEQQREYNRRSRDGHLILRIFAADESATIVPEIHVNPESRTWFINVPRTETRYRAELGFYGPSGNWETVSSSENTFTPPDSPAPEAAVQFATIPAQVSFQQIVEAVQEFVTEHQPLLHAVVAAQEAQNAGPLPAELKIPETSAPPQNPPETRPTKAVSTPHSRVSPPEFRLSEPSGRQAEVPVQIHKSEPWSNERRAALADLIRIDTYRRVWMGSIEITELVRRQLGEETASIAAADLARGKIPEQQRTIVAEFGISSPAMVGKPRGRKFWFKVNAELVLYGATEPDASVTIADRTVKLRPDGTFSFRFALPDGRYDLPAVARSAHGEEARAAILEFSRSTDYTGHVEPHPQDPALKSPRAENI